MGMSLKYFMTPKLKPDLRTLPTLPPVWQATLASILDTGSTLWMPDTLMRLLEFWTQKLLCLIFLQQMRRAKMFYLIITKYTVLKPILRWRIFSRQNGTNLSEGWEVTQFSMKSGSNISTKTDLGREYQRERSSATW